MGIREWCHRGHDRIVLSKIWPDGTRFRRFMPNRTVAKQKVAGWLQVKTAGGDKVETLGLRTASVAGKSAYK